jgi:hypothetical protein
METTTKRVVMDALNNELSNAQDNLYRWKMQNRNPEYRDAEAEAHWQQKADEIKAAIKELFGEAE